MGHIQRLSNSPGYQMSNQTLQFFFLYQELPPLDRGFTRIENPPIDGTYCNWTVANFSQPYQSMGKAHLPKVQQCQHSGKSHVST